MSSEHIFSKIGQGLGSNLPSIEGSNFDKREWISNVRLGIHAGLGLLDTAESYGNGMSEELIGEAIKGVKQEFQVATKFSPENSNYKSVVEAAEKSLRRLEIETIDLYQIHWPNPVVPLSETLQAMIDLKLAGKIQHVGVCNFSFFQLRKAVRIAGPDVIKSVQVEYNFFDRHVEDEILPFCMENGMFLIAYSPLDRGRISGSKGQSRMISTLAKKYGVTGHQVALAWLMRFSNVIPIPATRSSKHLLEIAEVPSLKLDNSDLDYLSKSTIEVQHFLPSQIEVSEFGEENRLVYRTLQEALENRLNFTPSPASLAQELRVSSDIKPVRVVPSRSNSANKPFDLIEGRVRFWAWVIAFGFDCPIPVYFRDSMKIGD